jgi:arginine exporter protein ArgO
MNIIKEAEIIICWVSTLALPIIGVISVIMFYTTNDYRPPTAMEVWLGLATATFYAWLMWRNYLKLRSPKVI